MGTEAVKLVYFGDSTAEQAFWRMPDGTFEPARSEARLYLKDRRTGSVRLIQG